MHWGAVFSSPETWQALVLSAVLSAFVTSISAALALVSVVYFQREMTRKPVAFAWYWPLAVPPIAAAFIGFQYLGKTGLAARLWPFGAFPELLNDPWHIGVMVMFAFAAFPFFCLLFVQYYHTERVGELLQSAAALGAGRRQQLWRVALPVLWYKSRPNRALWFIVLFGAYEIPWLLGRQSPQMISVLISRKFRKFNLADIPQAYALLLLYAIVVMIAAYWSLGRKKSTAA